MGWHVSGAARECSGGQLLGVPQICVDANECEQPRSVCDPLTVSCTNLFGSFRCGSCPAGYTGTGAIASGGCIPPMVLYVDPLIDRSYDGHTVVNMKLDLDLPTDVFLRPLSTLVTNDLIVKLRADLTGGLGVPLDRITSLTFTEDSHGGVHVKWVINGRKNDTIVNGMIQPSASMVAITLERMMAGNSTVFTNGAVTKYYTPGSLVIVEAAEEVLDPVIAFIPMYIIIGLLLIITIVCRIWFPTTKLDCVLPAMWAVFDVATNILFLAYLYLQNASMTSPIYQPWSIAVICFILAPFLINLLVTLNIIVSTRFSAIDHNC
jgi:hypothetical protein